MYDDRFRLSTSLKRFVGAGRSTEARVEVAAELLVGSSGDVAWCRLRMTMANEAFSVLSVLSKKSDSTAVKVRRLIEDVHR